MATARWLKGSCCFSDLSETIACEKFLKLLPSSKLSYLEKGLVKPGLLRVDKRTQANKLSVT